MYLLHVANHKLMVFYSRDVKETKNKVVSELKYSDYFDPPSDEKKQNSNKDIDDDDDVESNDDEGMEEDDDVDDGENDDENDDDDDVMEEDEDVTKDDKLQNGVQKAISQHEKDQEKVKTNMWNETCM